MARYAQPLAMIVRPQSVPPAPTNKKIQKKILAVTQDMNHRKNDAFRHRESNPGLAGAVAN